MADRSVIVALGANVSGFTAGMRTAQRSAQDFARNGLDEIARREQSLNQLSRNAGVLGLALTGMAGVAVKKFADFDHAMSAVEATGDDAKKSIDALREAALAASEQGFTPKDAAQGIENLAKAGVSASDILSGALTGSLDLAAAGSLGVAEAAETTSVALTQFNLGGEKATHVADLLAAGAGKAMGDVHDLAYALRMGGLVAAQTGLSIEETTAALASFASAGLLGSDAGTSLKTMLQRLTPRSKEAQAQFDQLGISAYDAQGNFIGLENFAGMLQEKMKDLTPEARNAAMSIMFGSDAVRAATVLYDQGASGMRNWIQAVDDQGYAAETAATKLDNLKGDVQLLGATFDRTMIEMGSSADGPLRSLVQGTTGVVEKLGELPASAQTALLGIVGGGGLVLLGIAGMGKLTVAISETRTAMAALGISARAATVSMGVIGVALGAGAILLGNWAKDAADAAAMTDDFLATLDEFGNTTDKTVSKIADSLANTDFGRSLGEKIMGDDSVNVIDWAKDAGIAIDDLTGYILGQEDAVKRVQAAQADYLSHSFNHSESDLNKMKDLTGILDKQADSLSEAEKVAVRKALADKELGLAAEGATPAADALGQAAAGASIGIDQVGDAAIEAEKALEDWRGAVADADGSFVDLADGYQSIIDKSREAAEQQASDTESTEDAWQDFYDGVTVSMQDYLAALEEQVVAQQDWEKNMLLLSGRVSQGVIDQLARLGPEGAPLVADLVNASDDELARLETVYGQRSADATGAFAENLRGAGPILAQIMKTAGSDAAAEAARALAAGEVTMQDVINQYDLNVVLGASTVRAQSIIDMFVSEQSKRQIMINVGVNSGGGGTTFVSPKAAGGWINGPGTTTSDSILGIDAKTRMPTAVVSNREFVVNARSAAQHGPLLEAINSGRFQALAGGGEVAPAAYQPMQRLYAAPAQSAPVIHVAAPSMEGATVTGQFVMDADGVVRLIDGRIAMASSTRSSSMRAGRPR